MLKLTVYKNSYALSLVGGYSAILKEKRSEHFSICRYYVYSSLCRKMAGFFWECFGYKIKYKGQVYIFDNLGELAEFVAQKTLKAG